MSFDYSTLIFDRTQADVDAQNDRGTYDYKSFNRVTQAMDDLFYRLKNLGYFVNYHPISPQHKDGSYSRHWEESDDGPRVHLVSLYLSNVKQIVSALVLPNVSESLPSSMEKLTYHGANNIESLLWEMDQAIKKLESTFVACGPATCGGDYI